MPVDINALEEWTVGDRMLSDMLRGMTPDEARAGRVAARHAAAGPARLAQGHRDPRPGRAAGRRRAAATAAPIPQAVDVDIDLGAGRRLTGTVVPGVRRPAGLGHLLASSTAGTCWSRGFRCWRCSLTIRAETGRRCASAAPKKGTTRGEEAARAAPTGRGRPAARPGGDLRRGPPRAAAAAAQDVLRVGGGRAHPRRSRNGRPGTGGSPATATPARTQSRRTCGRGARAALAVGPRSMRACDRLRRAGCGCRCCEPRGRRDGPLRPAGPAARRGSTTVLEASAGTGKTFALAGLVTRYVAEGVATLDQMLLITFSRAASQELRERVRGQIVDAVSGFRRPVVGRRQPGGRASARRAPTTSARPAPAAARRAGRLRRRDHRHHAPVLPAGAEIAWRGG